MAKDLDFWQNAKGEYETKIRKNAAELKALAVHAAVEDDFDAIRLAYWLDYCQSVPMPANGEELQDLINDEAEAFMGDYESLADAAENFATEFGIITNDDQLTWLVIDWAATWDSTFQWDYNSCEYTLAEEPEAEDFVQLPKFIGSGVWVWRND